VRATKARRAPPAPRATGAARHSGVRLVLLSTFYGPGPRRHRT
jgi:hypothetical protein